MFGDPLCNFPVEIIEHQDADEVDGAPSDGDGQALTQGALRVGIMSQPMTGQYSGHVIFIDQLKIGQ